MTSSKEKKIYILKEKKYKYKINYEKNLNPQQLEVVKSTNEVSIVVAGAGTGKTRTLVYRLAWLIENGVPPDQIILVTFTNKAANEMLHRIEYLLGTYPKGLMGGTFHHIGNILLRKYGNHIDIKSNFNILDDDDSNQIFKNVAVSIREQYKKEHGNRRLPSSAQINTIYRKHKDCDITISKAISMQYPNYTNDVEYVEEVIRLYEEEKKKSNFLDFSDLLIKWLELLKNNRIGQIIRKKFKHILVDEYQDVNNIQAKIIQEMGKKFNESYRTSIMVVGDDAQSIYSFRGADIKNFLDFPNHFNDCKIFKLEQNYRSTPEILKFSNECIKNNKHQFFKELWTKRESGKKVLVCISDNIDDQNDFIIEKILEFRDMGIELDQMAVLFRASYQSNELQISLTQSNIPYEIRGGFRFFEKKHIKDVISFLRIINNSADELAWTRCLQLIRGIGSKSAIKIFNIIKGLNDPLDKITQDNFKIHLKGLRINYKSWKRFTEIIKIIIQNSYENTSNIIDAFLKTFYKEYMINAKLINIEERIIEIEQLSNYSQSFSTLNEFIAHYTINLKISGSTIFFGKDDADDEKLILSTVHQAKGLEWKVVFIINATQGGFPISRAIGNESRMEEERRLFYVACTRAEDYLFVTCPTFSRISYYGEDISKPSQFIKEIQENYYEEVLIKQPT